MSHCIPGAGRLSQSDSPKGASHPQGPYVLARAVARPNPRIVPLRGDLAHIALAGKYFVPHYAVPQPRTVMPGGAPLLANPSEGAEELCVLLEGDSFGVLDVAGKWAWGCLSVEGPVGYVRADRLEAID